MTSGKNQSGAPSALDQWQAIDWPTIEAAVFRLQIRIAKTAKEKRWSKVNALQRLLTLSFYAKLLGRCNSPSASLDKGGRVARRPIETSGVSTQQLFYSNESALAGWRYQSLSGGCRL